MIFLILEASLLKKLPTDPSAESELILLSPFSFFILFSWYSCKNLVKDGDKFISFPFEISFFFINDSNFLTIFCYVFSAALSFSYFIMFVLYYQWYYE